MIDFSIRKGCDSKGVNFQFSYKNQEMLQMFVPGTAAVREPQPGAGLLSLLRHFVRPPDHQVLQSPAQVHLPALPENRRQHVSLLNLTERLQVWELPELPLMFDISSPSLYISNIKRLFFSKYNSNNMEWFSNFKHNSLCFLKRTLTSLSVIYIYFQVKS